MEKPVSPKDFIEGHHAVVDLQHFGKKLIEVADKYRYYMNHKCCGICDAKLSEKELSQQTIYDYTATCEKHRNLSGIFNVVKVREELGYPPYKNYFE